MIKLKKWIAITTIFSLLGMTGCFPAAQDGGAAPSSTPAGSTGASSSSAGAANATNTDEFPALDVLDLSQYKERAPIESFFSGSPNLSATKEDGSKYKIAYSHYDESDESVAYTCRVAKEMAEKYGFELVIFDAQQDPQKQRDHIAQAVTQKCDAVVVNPLDAVSISGAMKEAKAAGLTVICTAQTVDDESAYDVYTGPNDTLSGQMSASALIEMMPEGGKIGIIQGYPGSAPQIHRDEGFLGVMQSHPEFEILDRQTANWSTADAMNVMESYLSRYSDLDAVFCHFDLATLAAIQAAQASGRADDIIFVSVDGAQSALDAIATGGPFKMTAAQDFQTMVEMQFAAALAILNGDGDMLEKQTYINLICIEADNAKNFEMGWG